MAGFVQQAAEQSTGSASQAFAADEHSGSRFSLLAHFWSWKCPKVS